MLVRYPPMSRRRLFILAAVVAVLVAAGGAAWLQRHLRSYESNALADVSWTSGGTPFRARVTVIDASGAPVAGANVHVDNNSGGNDATTDAAGVAVIDLGEPEVEAIEVNGSRVMHRP